MSFPQPVRRTSAEDYLRLEEGAAERHQFFRGEIYAMSGGSPQHSLIILNAQSEIRSRLKGGPCRVYESNLRIRIPRTSLYTYPDASVICGPLEFDALDAKQHTILNPRLILEVLSPSTEAWDRGGKFENYQEIESFQEYLLISSEKVLVETFFRKSDGTWLYTPCRELTASVRLASLDITVPLADIYTGVAFAEGKTT